MNKHLRIEVNGVEWVNGDFAEITFTDGPAGVSIEGKASRDAGRQRNNGGGGGLLDLLAGASRARTAEVVEEKRAALADQPAGADEPTDAEVVEQP